MYTAGTIGFQKCELIALLCLNFSFLAFASLLSLGIELPYTTHQFYFTSMLYIGCFQVWGLVWISTFPVPYKSAGDMATTVLINFDLESKNLGRFEVVRICVISSL